MNVKARLAFEERDREAATNAASILSGAGFKITGISGRGVSFEGDSQQFQAFFQQELKRTGKGVEFESDPEMPKSIAEGKANLYFPTEPEFFP
jgi:hypothetical protein